MRYTKATLKYLILSIFLILSLADRHLYVHVTQVPSPFPCFSFPLQKGAYGYAPISPL